MGDEAGLGWPGRLWRSHRDTLNAFVLYNLGIRGQTLGQIRKRARAECEPRLQGTMGPLIVLGTGANDLSRFIDGDYRGKMRTPYRALDRNFRMLIDNLTDLAPVMVVGPAPVDEARVRLHPANQMMFEFRNEDIETGSLLYRDICDDLQIPYFDLYTALVDNADYLSALAEGDGLHPTGAGYQAVADAVANWVGWQKTLSEGWVK